MGQEDAFRRAELRSYLTQAGKLVHPVTLSDLAHELKVPFPICLATIAPCRLIALVQQRPLSTHCGH
jgi:hypothetical protein